MKKMTSTAIKKVFLSIEQFDKDLEDSLTIIIEPNGRRKTYYVCENISPEHSKSIVHVYILKKKQ